MAWQTYPDPDDDEWKEIIQDCKGKAKFLVDQNMGSATTKLLQSKGWNATDVFDLGIQGQPDENVFAAARRLDRILLTHDFDFLDDRKFHPRLNPGLVIFPGAEGDHQLIVSSLDRLLVIVGKLRELWRSTKIVINSDGSWRVYTFEQDSGKIIKTRYRFPKHGLEIWENADQP